jgi:hypothetical protein
MIFKIVFILILSDVTFFQQRILNSPGQNYPFNGMMRKKRGEDYVAPTGIDNRIVSDRRH